MPIAVETKLAQGLDRRDYEIVMEGLGLHENPPEGLLAHVATEHDGRIRILEVWESSRHYRTYRDSRLNPNIEYALGSKRAARNAETVRTRMLVRGFVSPGANVTRG